MIVKRDFNYSPLGKNRPLHIYLPDDYETSGLRYPVMYFFDGHNLFFDEDATYGKCWGLKEFLDSWDKKIIIVSMECCHEGHGRLSEYLPYPPKKIGFISQFTPLGMETLDWVVNEIKPMIDREYPTLPGREHTAIGGSSMGGLMSIAGGVHYNRYFSKAACVSSAIGFCMKPLMQDLRDSEIEKDSRFYLSWGTRETFGLCLPNREDRTSMTYFWNKKVWKGLEKKSAQVMHYCQVGGKHCEADWEKQLPIFMNWLWKD